MAWDLEGLIAGLLVHISCAGEQGCSVEDFLKAVQDTLSGGPASYRQTLEQNAQPPQDEEALNLRAASSVWGWLTQRQDVSVGPERKYNHMTLDQVMVLAKLSDPDSSDDPDNSREPTKQKKTSKKSQEGQSSRHKLPASPQAPNDLRLFASEETVWEALAGHGPDYKRLPRSEWVLLLGIASTKTDGILQGDLGRLVDQDKRSVPKRTDMLLKKGYITKRTTLVRGTKTSKMWLRLFAPPLVKEGADTEEPKADDLVLAPQFLTANLDPVPWHNRWTGESVDYIALATTIMAIAKEWGVMRLLDLKSKLGVLRLRWQMKVVSKICRFLNSRGVIQYVAARLHSKVFKDCIKYIRDLNSHDWSLYLATGKREAKSSRILEAGLQDPADGPDLTMGLYINSPLLTSYPPWTWDEPLASYVLKTARTLNETGVTNPVIYSLTLGSTFTRFLSTLTSSMATATVQPHGLKHLQLSSETVRSGKVASYRYFVASAPTADDPTGSRSLQDSHSSPSDSYGFVKYAPPTSGMDSSSSLSKLCGRGSSKIRGRGRPKAHKLVVSTRSDSMQPTGLQTPVAEETAMLLDTPLSESRPASPEAQTESPSRQPHNEPIDESLSVDVGSVVTLNDDRKPDLPIAVEDIATPKASSAENLNTPAVSDHLAEERIEETENVDTPADNMEIDQQESVDIVPGGEDIAAAENTGGSPAAGSGRGRGRSSRGGRGRGSGRGRGRGGSNAAGGSAAGKPYKCEKCGGAWKNDLGLKYHLEKARTTCNPSWDPSLVVPKPLKPPKRGKREVEKLLDAQSGPESSEKEPEVEGPVPSLNGEESNAPGTVGRRKRTARAKETLDDTKTRGKDAKGIYSLKVTRPRKSQPSRPETTAALSAPQTGQGLLIDITSNQTRQISDFVPGRNDAQLNSTEPVLIDDQLLIDPSSLGGSEGFGADVIGAGLEILPQSLKTEIDEQMSQTQEEEGPSIISLGQASPSRERKVPEKTKKPASRAERVRRIKTMLSTLLTDNNGVFPGGESLWRSLTMLWVKDYHGEPPPSSKDYQGALKSLITRKVVAEQHHVFRARQGLFAKCQVVSWPDMDPFSSQALELVEKVKAAHPKPYYPPTSVAAENPESRDDADVRHSRRPLPVEISTLDAPVYAAQAAAKRELEEANETPRQYKRRRKTQPSRPFKNDVKDSMTWVIAGELSDSFPMAHDGPIQFLDPNTFMEEEPPAYSAQKIATQQRSKRPYKRRTRPSPSQDDLLLDPALIPPVDIKPIKMLICGENLEWPDVLVKDFEEDCSFSLQGWMPTKQWFVWECFGEEIQKRALSRLQAKAARGIPANTPYLKLINMLQAAVNAESAWMSGFLTTSISHMPLKIFINFAGKMEQSITIPTQISWPEDGQLTLEHPGSENAGSDSSESSSWSEDETEIAAAPLFKRRKLLYSPRKYTRRGLEPIKRVPLASRALTALPEQHLRDKFEDGTNKTRDIEDPDEVLAAIVAVRALLGGTDKSIDWGLLVKIFPDISLEVLRRFWVKAVKSQGPYIEKYASIFHEKFLEAYEADELAPIDYDNLLDYDWAALVRWTMDLPAPDMIEMPETREELQRHFNLQDVKRPAEDWRERFFHVQGSIYGRLEAATMDPGVISLDELSRDESKRTKLSLMTVARSWVKSLCCTNGRYTPAQIKDQLLTLGKKEAAAKVASVLRRAIEQLTVLRVIRKSRRPPLGGRPYQLTEWYITNMAKLSQRSKFEKALAFKLKLDDAYRRGETLTIPYTVNDGTMMALANMSAHGRIRLSSTNIPEIPFGFEPGNYESRKFPKSYYHFEVAAEPTDTYLCNEDIEALGTVVGEEPPAQGEDSELPQWRDFFGVCDHERWFDVLGALCFAYSTRGEMTLEGICSAMKPVLEEFEAQMVLGWGVRTGVLREGATGEGVTVGEWWWLAVPWARHCARDEEEDNGELIADGGFPS
ncbi:unnamed protein product [Clonostachys solani]|uniref:C2H2-type domain-containing protein n=1 Tax=Clonostachys solani TaxID=160281 RepID=A0A9P0EN37_9HYPO|nr:unnamed protein product [Clonostachys solani]